MSLIRRSKPRLLSLATALLVAQPLVAIATSTPASAAPTSTSAYGFSVEAYQTFPGTGMQDQYVFWTPAQANVLDCPPDKTGPTGGARGGTWFVNKLTPSCSALGAKVTINGQGGYWATQEPTGYSTTTTYTPDPNQCPGCPGNSSGWGYGMLYSGAAASCDFDAKSQQWTTSGFINITDGGNGPNGIVPGNYTQPTTFTAPAIFQGQTAVLKLNEVIVTSTTITRIAYHLHATQPTGWADIIQGKVVCPVVPPVGVTTTTAAPPTTNPPSTTTTTAPPPPTSTTTTTAPPSTTTTLPTLPDCSAIVKNDAPTQNCL